MLRRSVGEGAVSSQQAVLQVCNDKGVLEIRSWAERRLHAMRSRFGSACSRIVRVWCCWAIRNERWAGESCRPISSDVECTGSDAAEDI